VYCVLVFPDFNETRWFERLPKPGMRIRSAGGHGYWGRTWVVDDVLQSGRDLYTVFLVDRREYIRKRRDRSEADLATELLEVARRTNESVQEVRRRKKNYLP
jgi:hypothetical protein